MPADVYTQRMQELDGAKAEKVQQMFPDLSRPSPLKTGRVEDLQGNLQPPKEQAPEMDMQSMFGRSFEQYKSQDSRFDQMSNDFTSLVAGLKQQVDAGMMPEIIAKQKMEQFVNESRGYFAKHKAKPMDNPENRAMVEGMLEGAMEMQQGGAQMPPQGAPAQQGGVLMPQGGM